MIQQLKFGLIVILDLENISNGLDLNFYSYILKKEIKKNEWDVNGQEHCLPASIFFPLLSTCIQRWVVRKGGIAFISLHHLEVAKRLYFQNLYPI